MSLADRYPDGITSANDAVRFLLASGIKRIEQIERDRFRITTDIAEGEFVSTHSTEELCDLARATFADRLASEQRIAEHRARLGQAMRERVAYGRQVDRLEIALLLALLAASLAAFALMLLRGVPVEHAMAVAAGACVVAFLADALWGRRIAEAIRERLRRDG